MSHRRHPVDEKNVDQIEGSSTIPAWDKHGKLSNDASSTKENNQASQIRQIPRQHQHRCVTILPARYELNSTFLASLFAELAHLSVLFILQQTGTVGSKGQLENK